jgi:hypothetical protein
MLQGCCPAPSRRGGGKTVNQARVVFAGDYLRISRPVGRPAPQWRRPEKLLEARRASGPYMSDSVRRHQTLSEPEKAIWRRADYRQRRLCWCLGVELCSARAISFRSAKAIRLFEHQNVHPIAPVRPFPIRGDHVRRAFGVRGRSRLNTGIFRDQHPRSIAVHVRRTAGPASTLS